MLKLSFPFLPLSVNKAFKSVKRGRMVFRAKSKEYKEYLDALEAEMPEELNTPIGPLSVEIDLVAPDWYCKNGNIRKVDADNYIKCLLDGVFAHLDTDDSCIFDIRVQKIHSEHERATELRIFELDLH